MHFLSIPNSPLTYIVLWTHVPDSYLKTWNSRYISIKWKTKSANNNPDKSTLIKCQ